MKISDIQVKQIEASNGLCPSLECVWQQISPSLPSHLSLYTYAWYQNWFKHYAARTPWTGRSCTLVAYRQEQVIAILPLALRRQAGLSILSLAGFYQPLRTWLCREDDGEAAGAAIAEHLLDHTRDWDICRLSPIDDAPPDRLAFATGMRSQISRRIETQLGRTIVHSVKPSMDDYQQSKTIKRIQSYERRFLRQDEADIRHYCNPDGQALSAMLDALAHIETHSWLAREGGDLRFATEIDRAYWQEHLATSSRGTSPFNVWIAYLHEEAVGFRVVLSSGDIDYMIANQFHEDHAKLRLGWVLHIHHLRDAVQRGVRLIDSAPGDFHYKGRLGSEEAEMRQSLLLFPRGLRGEVLFRVVSAANATRRALGRSRYGSNLANKIPRI